MCGREPVEGLLTDEDDLRVCLRPLCLSAGTRAAAAIIFYSFNKCMFVNETSNEITQITANQDCDDCHKTSNTKLTTILSF